MNINIKGRKAVDKRSFLFSLYIITIIIKKKIDHNSNHFFESVINTQDLLVLHFFHHTNQARRARTL